MMAVAGLGIAFNAKPAVRAQADLVVGPIDLARSSRCCPDRARPGRCRRPGVASRHGHHPGSRSLARRVLVGRRDARPRSGGPRRPSAHDARRRRPRQPSPPTSASPTGSMPSSPRSTRSTGPWSSSVTAAAATSSGAPPTPVPTASRGSIFVDTVPPPDGAGHLRVRARRRRRPVPRLGLVRRCPTSPTSTRARAHARQRARPRCRARVPTDPLASADDRRHRCR